MKPERHLENIRHREDGPAIEEWPRGKGAASWYIYGEQLTEQEFMDYTRRVEIIVEGNKVLVSKESAEALKEMFNGGV